MADVNNGEDGKNTGAAKGGNDEWGRKRGAESPTPRDPPATNGIGKKNWVAKGDDEGQGRGRGADSKKIRYQPAIKAETGKDTGVAKGGDTVWERETVTNVKIPPSHPASKGETGNDNGVAKSGDDDGGRGMEAWKIPQDEPSNIGETESNNAIANVVDDGWGRKRGEDLTARPFKTKGSWNLARRILSCNIFINYEWEQPEEDRPPPGVEPLGVLAARCAVKYDTDVT